MNLETKIGNKTICESENNYGAGGAFTPLAQVIECEALCNLISHLYPGHDDYDSAAGGHTTSAICQTVRKIESAGKQIDDGEYKVDVTVDEKKYEVDVIVNW